MSALLFGVPSRTLIRVFIVYINLLCSISLARLWGKARAIYIQRDRPIIPISLIVGRVIRERKRADRILSLKTVK
jgi:hypothetical protein